MNVIDPPRPIVILGPTAGGKSELAVALARQLNGQIIGADSMQVYRHMDAGTAKPPAHLRRCVTHHLIDIVQPTQRFTVADWLERADTLIAQIQASGDCPIVVGGTNLYIKALLEGLFDGPTTDPRFRDQLEMVPNDDLHLRLQAVDTESAQRIHPNDRKRMIRALEVYHVTGQPISQLQRQWDPPHTGSAPGPSHRHNPILIGLDWPIEAINRRINARVKAMFYPSKVSQDALENSTPQNAQDTPPPESLPDEVARLHRQDLLGYQASQALGYKQVIDHIQGLCTLEEAYEKTKILTRRFAKTQRTWLKRFHGTQWFPATADNLPSLPKEILDFITSCQ